MIEKEHVKQAADRKDRNDAASAKNRDEGLSSACGITSCGLTRQAFLTTAAHDRSEAKQEARQGSAGAASCTP